MSIQDVSNNLLTGSIWSPKTLNKIECCGAKFAYGQLDMTWERLIRLNLNMMKRPKKQFSETDSFMSCWYLQEQGVTTGVVSLLEWWSTQRANDRCKDYPDGRLATTSAPWLQSILWVTFLGHPVPQNSHKRTNNAYGQFSCHVERWQLRAYLF